MTTSRYPLLNVERPELGCCGYDDLATKPPTTEPYHPKKAAGRSSSHARRRQNMGTGPENNGIPAQAHGMIPPPPLATTGSRMNAGIGRLEGRVMTPGQAFDWTPRPQAIPVMGLYRPSFAQPRPLGQLLNVNPNVQVTVQTGLEKYLFPVGLMAAGGASFIVGSVLPEQAKPVTTIVGIGLIGWGVFSLIRGGTSGGASAAPMPPPPPPSGAVPIENSPAPFQPPSVPAFNQLQIEMVSPDTDQEIEHVGTFLGIGKPKIPVQMRFYNPTAEPVTFNLDIDWTEFPSIIGYNRDSVTGSMSFQVSLAPNEQKNQEFDLPVQTPVFATSVTVQMAVFKKRTPGENRFLVVNRTFSLT